MTKYVNKKGLVVNCPHCRGVIFKDSMIHDGEDWKVSFKMRCPHCQQDVLVKVDKDSFIIGKPSEDAQMSQENS